MSTRGGKATAGAPAAASDGAEAGMLPAAGHAAGGSDPADTDAGGGGPAGVDAAAAEAVRGASELLPHALPLHPPPIRCCCRAEAAAAMRAAATSACGWPIQPALGMPRLPAAAPPPPVLLAPPPAELVVAVARLVLLFRLMQLAARA